MQRNEKGAQVHGAKSETCITTQMLTNVMSMPQVTIDTYNGDPLKYNEFMCISNELVDNKPVVDQIKLTRLLQFTAHEAKNAIRNCALIGGTQGYQQARSILKIY